MIFQIFHQHFISNGAPTSDDYFSANNETIGDIASLDLKESIQRTLASWWIWLCCQIALGILVNDSFHAVIMILKIRYYPAIWWCMPITTFTDKQCNPIQHPMINAALPKLGINHNMPCTVVFGPLCYGGLDILSLSSEQLCKHTKMTISYLRSKSSTGTSLHHLMLVFHLFICRKNIIAAMMFDNNISRPNPQHVQTKERQ